MKQHPRRKWTRSRAYRRHVQRQDRIERATALGAVEVPVRVRYFGLAQKLALALARNGWPGLAKRVPLASVKVASGRRRLWRAADLPRMAELLDAIGGA